MLQTHLGKAMPDAFLDSSVLIGLVFRHAGERNACRTALPPGPVICSRYVVFEVARGFLRSLIALHNYSREFTSFADLHQAAYSGQLRFKPYQMATWLGAFTDYLAALEAEDGTCGEADKLEEFRAKLRVWIRKGWRSMTRDFTPINRIGCREDLLPPILKGNQTMDQTLPISECGQPAACRLQAFAVENADELLTVAEALEDLPKKQKDKETERRIEALRYFLAGQPGTAFEGEKCHRCGDALICLEASPNHVIATKNRKHFQPIAGALNKTITVPDQARATK